VTALERRAALLLASGDVHGAVASYRRLLPLIRADGTALAHAAAAFAEACERVGRSTDAREALEEARRLAPDEREIRRRLEAVYEAAGEPSRLAELVLEDAAEASGPERVALLLRAAGLLLKGGGDADRALEALEEARRADPDDPEGLLLQAEVWSRGGRADDALRLLTEWTEAKKSKSGPAASRVYLEIARLRLRSDDLFEALDALERSFAHDPRSVEASLLLVLVALDVDDERMAARAFRAITASRTDKVPAGSRAVAFYHLAGLADRRGDPRSARIMATHAVAEDPGHEGARALLDALGR
jgi:tetratricopeptide (TPR) repeat protein